DRVTPKTQHFLINVNIVSFLTPIFALKQVERDVEFLRLTSLGVIGAMSKTRDPQVVKYLMDNDVLNICIVTIQHAAEISRVISLFTLSKLFSDNAALECVCENQQRIESMAKLLFKSIESTIMQKRDINGRMVRYSIFCLSRMSDNPKATVILHDLACDNKALFKEHLPEFIYTKEQFSRVKFEEFCRNINFPTK
ncbi:cell differentiation protein rcd1, partial [Entamoeba invadens IP1]